MILKKINLALLGGLVLLASCNKDDNDDNQPVDTNTSGTAKIEFDHTWGLMGEHFQYDTWYVQPMTGDSLKFNDMRYYVTDVELTDINGDVWKESESYYLIDLADNTEAILATIDNVPSGDYVSISFLLGVDSAAVSEGVQPGVLAPSDMFWSWNAGYKFVLMEGESPDAVDNAGAFIFHLGGWKTPNIASVRRTIDFDGQIMEVRKDATPTVHLNMNVAHIWHDGTGLGQVPYIHMPGPAAMNMMTYFSHSFYLDHLHN